MKRGTPNHPKMYALAEALGVPLPMAVGIMEMLWQHAAQLTPRGDIGSLPDAAIALAVGWKKKATTLRDALVSSGWVENNADHRLIIHDWPEHCEQSVVKWLEYNDKQFLPIYGVSLENRKRRARDSQPSRGAKAEAEASGDLGSETEKPEGYLGEVTPEWLAERLWKIHPSPSKFGFVKDLIFKELRDTTKPTLQFADAIIASLEAWAEYWRESGRMATGLDNWIESGDFTRKPPPIPARKSKRLSAEEIAAL